MKGFVATLALFFLTVGLIVGNAIYINRIATRLEEKIEALPDVSDSQCAPLAEEILSYWKSHERWVALSASYTIADHVTEQATLLLVCARAGDVYGYRSAAALLLDAIDDMRHPELLIHPSAACVATPSCGKSHARTRHLQTRKRDLQTNEAHYLL